MKYIKGLSFVVISILLILTVYADGFNPLVYQYEEPETTVVFPANISISVERRKAIADMVAGIATNTISIPDAASPDNIICTLFGHDMAPTVSVTATHHKVNKYSPRCLLELHHVTYCNRCSYAEDIVVTTSYIFCCPED